MPTENKNVSEMTEFEAISWGKEHISVPYWTKEELLAAIDKWASEPESPTRTAMISGYFWSAMKSGEI